MPYCSRCGRCAGEGASFCTECGGRVDVGTVGAIRRPCAFCRGTGCDPTGMGFPPHQCPVCQGRRYNLVPRNHTGCDPCGGTGIGRRHDFGFQGVGTVHDPCEICAGTGWSEQ